MDPVVEVAGDDAVRPEQVAGGLPLNGDAVEILTWTIKTVFQFSDETGDNHGNPGCKIQKKNEKRPNVWWKFYKIWLVLLSFFKNWHSNLKMAKQWPNTNSIYFWQTVFKKAKFGFLKGQMATLMVIAIWEVCVSRHFLRTSERLSDNKKVEYIEFHFKGF